MAQDPDSKLPLPSAPPPSPARRDAAIEMALQRFDAVHGQASVESPGKAPVIGRAPRRSRISRPQIGLLVSVALIAVIGMPTVRKIMEQRPVAPHPSAPAPTTAFEPHAAPSSPAPAKTEPTRDTPPATAMSPVLSPPAAAPEKNKPAGESASPPEQAESAARTAQVPPSLMAPAPPSPVAAPSPPAFSESARVDRAARSAPRAEAADDASNIIVTARRVDARESVRAGRGDWNACTVNDPARSLDKCGKLISRDAKGDRGRAAAHVADGLTLAWDGDDGAAIAAFDEAIATAPKFAVAYLNRGLAYHRQGDLDRAIADLDLAARYNSGSARILYNRSLLLRERGQKGDVGKAESDEQRALTLDPDYGAVLK